MRNANRGAVAEFYDTHPISEEQILEKMRHDGVDLVALTEDVLKDYDQDHFGGVGANDDLALASGIDPSVSVLDVCCGLGGPARFLVQTYGCRVTGVDLTESRVEGARRLTEMAGLDDLVRFTTGDALDLPFADAEFDVVIAQEAFCHIPDKDRLIAQCVRVLRPEGRIAFTDIMATSETSEETRRRLGEGMTFSDLSTMEAYRERLEREGCTILLAVDLGAEWREILLKRLDMYRSLEGQTVERFGVDHFRKWDDAYSHFVGLYGTGELSGGRLVARKS